jgi:hypothetical protein
MSRSDSPIPFHLNVVVKFGSGLTLKMLSAPSLTEHVGLREVALMLHLPIWQTSRTPHFTMNLTDISLSLF